MAEPNREKLWQAVREEAQLLGSASEPIDVFMARMEKRGYILNFHPPSTKTGIGDRDFFEAIITYLNFKAGTTFTCKIPSANATLILNQRKAGYTLEQFKKIIDNKCRQWLGTQWQEALTPEQLFSKKHIDNYLGQKNNKHNGNAAHVASTDSFGKLEEAVQSAKRPVS
jgi:uncharacterized phage protein (TIGR02220 family)